MRNRNIFASVFLLVAEQRLSGCKAWVERVMAEWLKTLYSVVSRDHLTIRLDASRKLVGKPINPTENAKTCINNIEADYTGHTKTTNTKTYKGEKYGF